MSLHYLFQLILAVALLVAPCTLCAGDPTVATPGGGTVLISGGAARADHYYDTNGDQKRFDTLATTFKATTFSLGLNYGITEGLELNLEIPVGYYTISSKDRFPDRSIFSPSYYGIGATYQFSSGNIPASVSTLVKIPPGFHRGIYNDPAHPTFLSDGYFQINTALNFGFSREDMWVKGSAGYNWRDEEPADEITYSGQVGISRIQGTGIFLGFNGVISTEDPTQPLRPFYAGASGSSQEQSQIDGGRGRFHSIDRENYFAINAGAYADITSRFFLGGNYSLRLFGTNSLALQGAYLAAGYRL